MKVKITRRGKVGNVNYPTQATVWLEWATRPGNEEERCHATKETEKNEG
jgi:hypothetical protein